MKASERAATRHPMSFRATPEMKERIAQSASKNGRSVTAEIETLLERALQLEAVKDALREVLDERR